MRASIKLQGFERKDLVHLSRRSCAYCDQPCDLDRCGSIYGNPECTSEGRRERALAILAERDRPRAKKPPRCPIAIAGPKRSPLLLVGEKVPAGKDRRDPLAGRFLRRVAQLAGHEDELVLRTIAGRANVIMGDEPVTTDAAIRGGAYLRERARGRYRLVVVFGRTARRGFGLRGEWFGWHLLGEREVRPVLPPTRSSDLEEGTWIAACPHPSGVSRWWNEEANLITAAAWLAATITLATGGTPSWPVIGD